MSRADAKAELDKLKNRLATNESLLADRLVDIERAEGSVEDKRDREPANPGRAAELRGEIAALIREVKADKSRARQLRRRHKKLVDAVAAAARKVRNSMRPKVITLDLSFRPMSPQVYPLKGIIGHYTAGPTDLDTADALRLWRQYHAAHLAQGWSGLGYQVGITRDGTIVKLRPMSVVGSHTLGNNTSQIGFSAHGTTGDTWTRLQKRAYKAARKRLKLDHLPVTVHSDWMATACPGSFEAGYKEVN